MLAIRRGLALSVVSRVVTVEVWVRSSAALSAADIPMASLLLRQDRYAGEIIHTADHPSSTGKITPLIPLAADEARKTMAAAGSSGSACRPRLA
jgi:hypothetical protein